MTNWNLANCLDTIAGIRKTRPAIIQGNRSLNWLDFERNAQTIAAWLSNQGLNPGSKVAIYCYNHIAYLESSYACFKASFIPVNINYRYKEQELLYLFNNSDSEAIVIHAKFLPMLTSILHRLQKVRAILVVDGDGDNFEPGLNATTDSYEALLKNPGRHENPSRTGDDIVFMYTGGTTGMPKGVMWRQRDLYQTLSGGTSGTTPRDQEAFRNFIIEEPKQLRALILPPLMHGTAFFSSLVALLAGGTILLTENLETFDPAEVWTIVSGQRPNILLIVGDAFARPLVKELEKNDYDITSLESINSSGALWSKKTKELLLKHSSKLTLYDGLGSSEAHNIGTAITTVENVDEPLPTFVFGENTLFVNEELEPLTPAPGTKGMLAVAGAKPVGYYRDDEKSTQLFTEINGRQCTLTGDWAIVNADGKTFTLLGRGSVCINTGGEKVFPEEVEATIKQFEDVADAIVVGIPDDRWGEIVAAVVSTESHSPVNPDNLRSFVKSKLASYKAPKHIIPVPIIARSPSGKADYGVAREIALEYLNL
jgi:acyl-CoA synthetase (AMP-forming)/AMP-acid ligase II